MKSLAIYFSMGMVILCCSCTPKTSDHPQNWSDKKLTAWYNSGEWRSGWEIAPDESVNQREMAIQYLRNRERWDKAFNFLKTSDLKNLETGRYELDGDSVFVTISEYMTKNEEDARFEAHQSYADIPYLVDGEEQIGIIPLAKTTETVPYDTLKDIVFLSAPENNYHLATPERFFVFFPGDAHCPGVKKDENQTVRKVVVKILLP